VGIIEELSFTTVRHRLASYLLCLAQKSGKRTSEGVEVTLPLTNQELAAQIGTVRELVSRNLSRLQAEGLLKIEGREVMGSAALKIAPHQSQYCGVPIQ